MMGEMMIEGNLGQWGVRRDGDNYPLVITY